MPGAGASRRECRSPGYRAQRALFARSLALQFGVLALLGAAVAWIAPQGVWIALAGGAIAWVANLVFGALALIERRSAGAVVTALWMAEVGKFCVVAVGFALLFRNLPEGFDRRTALLAVGAFAATLSAQWLALLVFRTRGPR